MPDESIVEKAQSAIGVPYPLRIHVPPYGGKDKKKMVHYQAKLADAKRIEDHVNGQIKPGDNKTINYYEIALDLAIDKERVREICFPVDGSSNGITIFRRSEPPQTQAN